MLLLSFSILVPVALAILIAITSQGSPSAMIDILFGSVDTPPPDFGSGQMFDQIAGRYDMINRVLALRMDISWRQQMTRRIQQLLSDHHQQRNDNAQSSSSSLNVLDLATGTADVALQLAKDLPPSTIILGLDPSTNMLAVGREKVSVAGLDHRISLEEADARDLSQYQSHFFDAATMSFGIRNVPDPRRTALCEIHRLLKPDQGILGILEFSAPDDSHGFLGTVARWFIVHVVPIVGGILSGSPREYLHLQNSIQDFPSPEAFRTLLQDLQCPGHFEMEPVRHMNFGSVQLYIGRAVGPTSDSSTRQVQVAEDDPVLPPIRKSTASFTG